MNEPVTLSRAKALFINPLDWMNISVEDAICGLQSIVWLDSLQDGAPGPLHLVHADPSDCPFLIDLCTTEPLPLTTVLARLAEQAALSVEYFPSGIVLKPLPAEEHQDDAPAENTLGQATPEPVESPAPLIPGMPPSAPEPPPALLEQPLWMQAIDTHGLTGLECKRFIELLSCCEHLESDGEVLDALVALVTIYPQRPVRLARDTDRWFHPASNVQA